MFILPEYTQKLQLDIRHLRILNARLDRSTDQLREKADKLEEEKRRLEKENNKLRKENNQLKQEIEKLTKTNSRYRVSLFDHGNFKHPDDQNRKEKGGQIGHLDTNRESYEDYSSFEHKRMYAKTCGNCGGKLKRVFSVKQKILIDIVINPQVVKMILESERQWCGNCRKEVTARDARCLPFSEYGINTLMAVMILRFKCHSSFANISTVIAISHGLEISESDISSILRQAKIHLKSKYNKMIEEVRNGKVIYSDETGWLINGQSAWMWIMTNEDTTVYFAAESRGKGIAEELYGNSHAFSMHDGLASYLSSAAPNKQCYCWAHFLRFAFEETVNEKEDSEAVLLCNELVRIYRIKSNHPEYSLQKLKNILTIRLDQVLKITLKNQNIINIQNRLKTQKTGLINSLLYTKDGTNNLSERELRNMAIKKRISNGSNTFKGMETTAVLGSIMHTLAKKDKLLPNLANWLQDGIKEKYRQYSHTPYYDSS